MLEIVMVFHKVGDGGGNPSGTDGGGMGYVSWATVILCKGSCLPLPKPNSSKTLRAFRDELMTCLHVTPPFSVREFRHSWQAG